MEPTRCVREAPARSIRRRRPVHEVVVAILSSAMILALFGPASGRAPEARAQIGSAAGRASDRLTGAPASPDGALSACSDTAYTLYSNSWSEQLKWYFNSHSTPSGIDRDDAKGALRGAVKVITHGTNDCGLADGVGATAAYQTTTKTSVNITRAGSCKSGDGKSVVGFGTLPSDYLALTCWWTNSKGHTIEADIRLNKAHYSWSVDIPKNCSNVFIIKDVATHEFGHVFGMGHVSESNDGKLTMSPTMMACQTSETTLGLGDVLGLEAKY